MKSFGILYIMAQIHISKREDVDNGETAYGGEFVLVDKPKGMRVGEFDIKNVEMV